MGRRSRQGVACRQRKRGLLGDRANPDSVEAAARVGATLVYQFEADAASGTVVSGEVAWATLTSLEPAIGTLAIASASDGLLWTHKVRIPSKADIVRVRFVLGQRAPAGSALYFHVRNHGNNNWQLGPLTLTTPGG